jgi:heterodisulfide reductase subunit A-like polyferredoxin
MKAGVFVCSCNGTLNEDGRLEEIIESLQGLPGVAHGEVLVSACHPEKGLRIERAMEEKALNSAVIASCTCCHFDFACESCTDQRMRLKHRLFKEKGYHPGAMALVNIKETCLLPFKEDGERGRDLALRVIRWGLEQLKETRASALAGEKHWPQALVLGASEAGVAAALGLKATCPSVMVAESGKVPKAVEKLLSDQGIGLMCPVKPMHLEGRRGHFTVVVEKGKDSQEGGRYEKITAGLIILGRNEYRSIPYTRDAFARAFRARPATAFGSLETGIAGVYLASWPQARTLSREAVGLCAASEALESARSEGNPKTTLVARVDPEVCRGCGRCADICPEGAAYLEETTRGVACSVIDSRFCTGCGNCLAECPTGAIHMPESEQEDYEKVIHALLG